MASPQNGGRGHSRSDAGGGGGEAVTTVAVATAAVAAAVVGCCGGGGGGGGGMGGCRIPRGVLLGGLVSAAGSVASSPHLGSGEGGCKDHGEGSGSICGE
jgi:hypothetical protein